ncbi:hypothetical protein P7C70_g3673, partial [Phenoliferia sp. Uapishka_3]
MLPPTSSPPYTSSPHTSRQTAKSVPSTGREPLAGLRLIAPLVSPRAPLHPPPKPALKHVIPPSLNDTINDVSGAACLHYGGTERQSHRVPRQSFENELKKSRDRQHARAMALPSPIRAGNRVSSRRRSPANLQERSVAKPSQNRQEHGHNVDIKPVQPAASPAQSELLSPKHEVVECVSDHFGIVLEMHAAVDRLAQGSKEGDARLMREGQDFLERGGRWLVRDGTDGHKRDSSCEIEN